MGYERYPRGMSQGDDHGREPAGRFDRDDRHGYGPRDYGNQRYTQRDRQDGVYQGGRAGPDRDAGYSNDRHVERGRYGADADRGAREYHGSYGSGGRPFEDFGRYKHADDDDYRSGERTRQGYGRQPQGYDYEDRGFFARAGDEVRSWFGDEDAERRRDHDSRMDERYANDRDNDYQSWRRGQIQSLDRDYEEYRRENRTKFESEFGSWRTGRQTQRDALGKVEEHMDVVGSDGGHVGTVDKVRGDRILLTRNDADAGGRHHSIPSSWLDTVDARVTLRKSAAEAKAAWRDEERNQALFGDEGDRRPQANTSSTAGPDGGKTLNRSFPGTY